jgi:hypothetical protein
MLQLYVLGMFAMHCSTPGLHAAAILFRRVRLLCLVACAAVAEGMFGIPISTLANPWWIVADAKFMEGNIGG